MASRNNRLVRPIVLHRGARDTAFGSKRIVVYRDSRTTSVLKRRK